VQTPEIDVGGHLPEMENLQEQLAGSLDDNSREE
jgi:hypothetical protein